MTTSSWAAKYNDDRLEIQSSGGMFEGKPIQECDISAVSSVRRNPVIADLFHRMKYMERRGSGLKKILSETAKLPGYTEQLKLEFFSTPSDFRAVLKNVNYNLRSDTAQDRGQVTAQDGRMKKLVEFCSEPRTRNEMQAYLAISSREHFRKKILKPLLESGQLKITIPDKPNSKNQKYVKA